MATPNPYAPTDPHSGDVATTPVAPPSTWLRNFKALAVVAISYSLLCALFAVARAAMPEALFVVLLVFASVASAWANVPLGPQIGWDRGGLPVVLVLFFVALTAYCFAGLLAGGILYSTINPVTIYTPYSS